MKTISDLPDHLVLNELVADYIRQGLHGGTSGSAPADSDGLTVDGTGLPVFRWASGLSFLG
ncbi:hypothetical protein KBZ18_10375 [Synechococcus sp. Cruz-9H2]|uniref:hypothetical protein n=1 Tax=unclassified Synechococcus TaxID=2626047 RepID=UPI0020CED32E|nr:MULTISPECIES: hypothetical protein [unclassified Synechococcus]MCP9819897.1 hypothetical protein [Synechococcus sp. Cruz-9H2]MCP9844203.1 hypothetical protein [Synechococcus sp. Edmonson 11F2]MCP9856327.1 hypothetical protein [Synechococcus sp. Cruz-9C9]MCP9863612.1 hypothetical protein [Synechococcus sp. Cruz-7E5]MCP9870808.1 hypothetical protein [Synechococcus sp. Cruz-7B9]